MELGHTRIFDMDPTVISLETASGNPVAVNVTLKNVMRATPSDKETAVILRTCNVTGCLPNHEVAVGPGEAIIMMDLEFLDPRTTDAGTGNAYFKPEYASFKVDGVTLPVLELRQEGDIWLERPASFYVEPTKQVKQSLFTRVRQDAQDITLVYGTDMNQSLSLQACFAGECARQREERLKAKEKETGCEVNGQSVPCEEIVQKVSMFAKMGLGILVVLLVIGTLATVLWVMMLVHAAKHPIEHKAIWILALLFLNIPAVIAYYFAIKRPLDAAQKVVSSSSVPPTPPTPPSPVV